MILQDLFWQDKFYDFQIYFAPPSHFISLVGFILVSFSRILFSKVYFVILQDLFVPPSPLYKFGKIYFVFLQDLWENLGIQVGR